ncbi:hypothetical protein POM88_023643 [Heracleum sosnowskyi]|uniref:Uncharacterized protein n=1 Tax=Heracleum sosnowskyi TaxID=360622 RepID=A0AAD8MW39_9APIA|nr:hypothetical protein POM88_023643 [Heracleum sosnowskyi]
MYVKVPIYPYQDKNNKIVRVQDISRFLRRQTRKKKADRDWFVFFPPIFILVELGVKMPYSALYLMRQPADQCEREFHVTCLKEHNNGDLKGLPAKKWFIPHHAALVWENGVPRN